MIYCENIADITFLIYLTINGKRIKSSVFLLIMHCNALNDAYWLEVKLLLMVIIVKFEQGQRYSLIRGFKWTPWLKKK